MKFFGGNESSGCWIALGALWGVSDVLHLLDMLRRDSVSWISLLLLGLLAVVFCGRGLFLILANRKIK